jgi:hypothetical protein
MDTSNNVLEMIPLDGDTFHQNLKKLVWEAKNVEGLCQFIRSNVSKQAWLTQQTFIHDKKFALSGTTRVFRTESSAA